MGEHTRINQKWDILLADNRNLKSKLLDAERYKEEYREESEIVDMLKKKLKEVLGDIEKTRSDLQKARMDGVMPHVYGHAPKYNKDTKVNLDMSMWITHNITEEQYEPYQPEIKYYEAPKYEQKYEEPKYEEKYEEPKYEQKYEEPKYEEQKYEEPKYEEPKYEEPKYEAPKYEEKKYEEPKYEEPATEEPKYEEPATEAAKYEEPKYEAKEY